MIREPAKSQQRVKRTRDVLTSEPGGSWMRLGGGIPSPGGGIDILGGAPMGGPGAAG